MFRCRSKSSINILGNFYRKKNPSRALYCAIITSQLQISFLEQQTQTGSHAIIRSFSHIHILTANIKLKKNTKYFTTVVEHPIFHCETQKTEYVHRPTVVPKIVLHCERLCFFINDDVRATVAVDAVVHLHTRKPVLCCCLQTVAIGYGRRGLLRILYCVHEATTSCLYRSFGYRCKSNEC